MPDQPSVAQIRQCVERILRSPAFISSERMCRFLREAVDRALEGRTSELKEYTLGVEVFDRPASFDPRVDPIVRVEARRLREKLAQYYRTSGSEDQCVIDLPKGSYVPAFRTRRAEANSNETGSGSSRSLAVLPFTSPDSDFLGDGLTQQIIHRLTRTPGLRVLGWQSASRMRDRADVYEAAGELRAEYALTGTIRTNGPRLRVAAQLLDLRSREFLWSEFYDRTLSDLFAIEEDIADAIVSALRVRFGLVRPRAANPEAYELYVRGRYHWNKRTREGLRLSVEYLRRALDLDPEFALGWAGLADTYILQADYGLMEPGDVAEAARRAAERALELDPALGEAETALAFVAGHRDWDWESSERHYRRAMELSPAYATAFHWFGTDYCALRARFEEGAVAVSRAMELDPLSSIIREGVAYFRLLQRNLDSAVAEYERLMAFDPTFYKAVTSIGRVWIQKGDYDKAIGFLEKGRDMVGCDLPSILAALGQAHALAGRAHVAREIYAQLHSIAAGGFVYSTCFATVCLGLGERDEALNWLARGCERREFSVTSLGVHPLYDPLRGDPRFEKLVAMTGLLPGSFALP